MSKQWRIDGLPSASNVTAKHPHSQLVPGGSDTSNVDPACLTQHDLGKAENTEEILTGLCSGSQQERDVAIVRISSMNQDQIRATLHGDMRQRILQSLALC